MNYNGSFNPKFLTGTQLYFAKNTATVSSWNDQSSNGFTVTQGTALNQPTIGANSVNFVPNQFMSRTVANAFSGDNSGYIFFSGYYVSGSVNRLFSSSDVATVNHNIAVSVLSTGQVAIFTTISGAANLVQGNTILTNGSYFYGYVYSNGSSYTISVNGVIQTLTGTNTGSWFNDVVNRDNIVIGALIRSIPIYGSCNVNKLYYNNTALSASDLWKTEQFFANPLNYD
jgi:hypothetical protein